MAPALESHQEKHSLEASQDVSIDNADTQIEMPTRSRVTVVGSGNWGSVAAKLIASNTLKLESFHGLLFSSFYALLKFLFFQLAKKKSLHFLGVSV